MARGDTYKYDFYGLPVRCRIELRDQNKETLILSLWDVDLSSEYPEDHTPTMLLESNPMRLSKLEREQPTLMPVIKSRATKEAQILQEHTLPGLGGRRIISHVLNLAVIRFLDGKLSQHLSGEPLSGEEVLPDRKAPAKTSRNKQAAANRAVLMGLPLPLSGVIAAYWSRLLDEQSHSRATVLEDQRSLQKLLSTCGDIPWKNAVPADCLPRMKKLSDRQKKSCVRLMCRLFDQMVLDGVTTIDPWEDYHLSNGWETYSYNSCVRRHIEPAMLTDAQMCILLDQCLHSRKPPAIRLALLLFATQGLSSEEICGLNVGDFYYLRDFPSRLALSIERTFQPKDGNQNSSLTEITVQHKRRKLPLARVFNQFYSSLIANVNMDSKAPAIIHHGRRINPSALKKEVSDFVKDLLRPQITDVKHLRILASDKLLQNTAWEELRNAGYEDEEVRYQKGMAPQLTSAKSYCDFANEKELNKLGSIQDAWLSRVLPQSALGLIPRTIAADILPARKRSLFWTSNVKGCRTALDLIVTIPAVSDNVSKDGLLLEISASHAYSGTVEFKGGCI